MVVPVDAADDAGLEIPHLGPISAGFQNAEVLVPAVEFSRSVEPKEGIPYAIYLY